MDTIVKGLVDQLQQEAIDEQTSYELKEAFNKSLSIYKKQLSDKLYEGMQLYRHIYRVYAKSATKDNLYADQESWFRLKHDKVRISLQKFQEEMSNPSHYEVDLLDLKKDLIKSNATSCTSSEKMKSIKRSGNRASK